MANKRVTELSELLAAEVSASDYLLISDVSAVESKKIRASELKTYAGTGVTASYALVALSSSHATYADSASYCPCVSASYALSASYADFAKTASYVISASYSLSSSWAYRSFFSTTASYALTSSVQLVISSGMADYATSASHLIYTSGSTINGTASYAVNANWARSTSTSSYLLYSGTPNGIASNALTASQANTSSYLEYSLGENNGTASYALLSYSASNATVAKISQTTNNIYLYREFPIVTSSIVSTNTASFGWMQFSSSAPTTYISMEAWGDVLVSKTNSENESGSLELVVEGYLARYELDYSAFRNYFTGSSTLDTGSIICPFYLKGQFSITTGSARYSGSVLGYNGVTFYTGSRDVKTTVRATTDYFVDE